MLRFDDPRLSGTWRLIAATSGNLDHRPCICSATVELQPARRQAVRFTVAYSTPSGARTRSGRIRPRPQWRHPRTWSSCLQWFLIASMRGQIRLSTSGSVLSVATGGSILMNPGVLILARGDLGDESAWTEVYDDMAALQLTPMSVRELSWRIKAPGTDPSRYQPDPVI